MAITTNVFNLGFTRGDTVIHKITVKNSDETVKDITGATVKYTIRSGNFAGTQVLQKTTTAGISLTTPTGGVLEVTLTAVDTAALDPNVGYVYDCEVILSGQTQTVQTGAISLTGDVSY